jgi:hypothetical protein
MAPVMLVRGTRSGPWWFDEAGGQCGSDPKGNNYDFSFIAEWVLEGIPFDCKDIQINPELSFQEGADALQEKVTRAAQSFGTKYVHIVAHSNGGNWARTMLGSSSSFIKSSPYSLGVLFLTTISTPFSGTVLADVGVAGHDYIRFLSAGANYVYAHLFMPDFGDLDHDSRTGVATSTNLALSHATRMTVSFRQGDGTTYNRTNSIQYFSLVANADANGVWFLTPAESYGFGIIQANVTFRPLATTDRVLICSVDLGTGACTARNLLFQPVYEPAPCLRPNDATVTAFSAIWPNPLWPSSPTASYFQLPQACSPASLQPTGTPSGLALSQQFHPVYAPSGSPSHLYWPYNHTALANTNVAKAILSNLHHVQPLQW